MKITQKFIALAVVGLMVFTLGCEKEKVEGTGKFNVAMTDAPADFSRLDVEIAEVSVYSEASGWVELNSEAQMVNILSLTNGKEVSLNNNTEVAAGHYTRLRITFGDNNSLTVVGSSAVALGGLSGLATVELNYAGPRSIDIEIDQNVEAGSSASVLVDFHAAESIIDSAGNHYIRPAITYLKDKLTGVRGEVSAAASAHVEATMDGNPSFSYETYLDAEGRFLIRNMREGVYDIVIRPASSLTNPDPEPITIENVTVVSGSITSTGAVR